MGNEVALRDEDVKSLVHSQIWDNRRQFATLLPSTVDVDVFAGSAAAAMYKNPALCAAAMRQPETLVIALRECARLGHQPGTDEYALTVRGGGILGIEQYQGAIHRMYNAGAVQAVHAEVVTVQERLERRDPLPPIHHVPGDDWMSRDIRVANLKGAYAYAVLEGGVTSRIVVMGKAQIMTHRDKAGKNREGVATFWDGEFGLSMWLKTAVHELEKWVPTSASYRQERARADVALAQMLGQTAQTAPERPDERGPSVSVPASVGEPTGDVGAQ